MKLKNSALQELYDTVVASTITISPYEASPIDKAFRECDEKLSGENRSLNARIDCLRLEVNWYRKHYREQYDKIRELKFRLNRGQTDLWNMLQNVNDAKPFELATCFPDVTCMDDILSWNLEDFLDAYKSWQEKKDQERIKHMRDYLERFCMVRFCYNCPLHTVGLLCERGKLFCDMSDEDLKKHYEKARACSKPLSHWECTLEGTVEINKDLLNKVCGIDSDD